jgi:2'-5' RNA ligase
VVDDATSQQAHGHLQVHGEWRPEWAIGRERLCWYLTFGDDFVALLDPAGLEAVRRTEWLDAVPWRWLHVTLCDVGFVDELSPTDVEDVLAAGRRCVVDLPPLQLGFGRAAPMEDAIALPVEPVAPVRHLQQRLRADTERALDPSQRARAHPTLYLPHLSLGYANRATSASEVARLLERMGDVHGEVTIEHLVLAAVTRHTTHYEWTVVEDVPLRPATAGQ